MNLNILIGLIIAILGTVTAYYKYATSKEASGSKIENSALTSECSPNISNINANGSITIENSGCNKK